jgi:Tol biopolymer transport system component
MTAGSRFHSPAVVRAGLLAVALSAAFTTGCGGRRHAPGTIVFQSDRSGGEAVYAVRPDGSGRSRIPVNLPPEGADVFWTRDGTKALVVYDTGTGSAVANVFEPANRTRRRIRLRGIDLISDMPWSPDGKQLVLMTKGGDVVLDVETGKSRPLMDVLADDLLTWSPDGKSLLFSSGPDLYAAPADGGPPTPLLELGRIHPRLPAADDVPGELQWSSDGKWISFLDEGLYAVRSDGTQLRLIDHRAEELAWSPTGERLVFPSRTGLVLVDLQTGRRRRLTREHLDDDLEGLAWSRDGERIAYLRNDLAFGADQAFHAQLWTVDADGSDQRAVTRAFLDDGTITSPRLNGSRAACEGRRRRGFRSFPCAELAPSPPPCRSSRWRPRATRRQLPRGSEARPVSAARWGRSSSGIKPAGPWCGYRSAAAAAHTTCCSPPAASPTGATTRARATPSTSR